MTIVLHLSVACKFGWFLFGDEELQKARGRNNHTVGLELALGSCFSAILSPSVMPACHDLSSSRRDR